jgi:hypothetical protein
MFVWDMQGHGHMAITFSEFPQAYIDNYHAFEFKSNKKGEGCFYACWFS